MTRLEFINDLGRRLSSLPPQEAESMLDYYVESIEDRMEDGMTEAAAIESLGPTEELAAKVLSEQEKPVPKKRRPGPGTIVLLVLGSPVWLSLLLAAAAVVLAVYLVAWAMLAVLAVTAAALILGGIVGAVMSFLVRVTPNTMAVRVLSCGACLFLAALGFLLLPASVRLIRAFGHLRQTLWQKIRNRKERRK